MRIFAVVAGIVLLAVALPSPWAVEQEQGVTFSAMQAEGLGLSWKQTYGAMLNDLGVRHIRLVAQWDRIEKERDKYNWSEMDYQMDLAREAGADVLLSVGRKLPRWPECHIPQWASGLSEEQQQEEVMEYLGAVVERYKGHKALSAWQLENEPLLDFGECPPADEDFLALEEDLLRFSGGGKPIVVTDSGELNWWIDASRFGDVLGTTMYRTVWSKRTDKLFHYDYLFPASLYRAKGRLVKVLRGKPVVISELQGEPWGKVGVKDMSAEEREASVSAKRLDQIARFARRTQFSKAYWWGVEYWYWEKEANANADYWETARGFFE